jgi:aerobic carbon-monoxide dehydrogenase small subunit
MLLTATAMLQTNPQPSEADIRHAMAGNLCRCTGYTAIVNAVQAAAQDQDATSAALVADGDGAGS